MSIKNSYEQLAKLLYPSIEASGNVYYGQTRKLLLDLYINSGYKSYIDQGSDGTKYYNWSIGCIKDRFQFDPDIVEYSYPFDVFYDDVHFEVLEGTDYCTGNKSHDFLVFAKYKLTITDTPVDNILYSGSYRTYEKTVSAERIANENGIPISVVTKWFNPANTTTEYSVDANQKPIPFVINRENGDWILYVYLYTSKLGNVDYFDNPSGDRMYTNPLRLTVTQGTGKIYLGLEESYMGMPIDYTDYQYRTNTSDWADTAYDGEGYPDLSVGDWIEFRVKEPTTNTDWYYKRIYQSSEDIRFSASGNIKSLLPNSKISIRSDVHTITNLFQETGITNPPAFTLIGEQAVYRNTFLNCKSLINPYMVLPSKTLVSYCYCVMFSGCENLQNSPIMIAPKFASHCYDGMFRGCGNLLYLSCATYYKDEDCEREMYEWVVDDSVTNLDVAALDLRLIYNDPDRNIINDCRENIQDHLKPGSTLNITEIYKGGCDSIYNGRGVLADDTKGLILDEFSKVNNEDFTSIVYNNGDSNSHSETIWGAKIFNSPVLFRNGIYGIDPSKWGLTTSINHGIFRYEPLLSNFGGVAVDYDIYGLHGNGARFGTYGYDVNGLHVYGAAISNGIISPEGDNVGSYILVENVSSNNHEDYRSIVIESAKGSEIGRISVTSEGVTIGSYEMIDSENRRAGSSITMSRGGSNNGSVEIKAESVYINRTPGYSSLYVPYIGSESSPSNDIYSERFHGELPIADYVNHSDIGYTYEEKQKYFAPTGRVALVKVYITFNNVTIDGVDSKAWFSSLNDETRATHFKNVLGRLAPGIRISITDPRDNKLGGKLSIDYGQDYIEDDDFAAGGKLRFSGLRAFWNETYFNPDGVLKELNAGATNMNIGADTQFTHNMFGSMKLISLVDEISPVIWEGNTGTNFFYTGFYALVMFV